MFDSKPRITFENDDIKEFIGDDIEKLNIGDSIKLNITCVVKGINRNEYNRGDIPVAVGAKSSKKEPKKEIVNRVELEVVGKPKKDRMAG
jgi:hypothetical protein